jgi:hypothetical protein
MRNTLIILGICLIASCSNSPSYKEDKLDSERLKEKQSEFLNLDTVPVADSYAFMKFFEEGKGLVPDAKTASKLAFIYLSNIYGEKEIRNELPLIVYSVGDYWYIEGTFKGTGKGGVAELGIKKSNGQIIGITHGK